MASLSCALYLPIKCSSIRENGSISNTPQASSALSVQRPPVLDVAYAVAFNPATSLTTEQIRQSIPTEKQLTDPFRHGLIVEGGVRYRQTVVIRSYEVGPDKTATLETILNLLQETALNHVWLSGLLGDGFGATHGMMRNNLIWVVTRMHVLLDEYPIWGEVVEIDTWVGASGKNGMRRDWLLRSPFSGQVFCRATRHEQYFYLFRSLSLSLSSSMFLCDPMMP
ncbi:hypothetical protein C4D60_Mb01t03120 [Musa balbisiana]|uniref:Acyl-[acyl-carrier-protein] hydrolase n=1 Tax=Musa balbisiana TaxID=52838 RepID=A0A4S8JJG6_MUSBA|nr:hypothetical protein C4D60_Mb01t03120 [Musa balbisiana]